MKLKDGADDDLSCASLPHSHLATCTASSTLPPPPPTCPPLEMELNPINSVSSIYTHLNLLQHVRTYAHSFIHSLSLSANMDSQNLKQRRSDEPSTRATMNKTENTRTKRDMRMDMAKRGLRSLAIAVSLPVSLHLLSIYLGSTDTYATSTSSSKPFWFPPLWALRLTCLASSFLMGLSAWLVWAEGGFHNHPTALPLFLAQLALSFIWDPIVFGAGATLVGLIVCIGMFGALVACSRVFKNVNPTAGDLMKPCLAWVAFLAVVNLKLIYL